MKNEQQGTQLLWLVAGLVGGLCIASMWPGEPAKAVTTDRNSKFALATSEVSFAGTSEAVFALDFLTGRLTGGILNNRSGKFTHAYYRNVAADFQLDPKIDPTYAIVTGRCQLPGARGVTPAQGVVYVAELTSGKVAAYVFPYKESNQPLPPAELTPTDFFTFREAVN